MNKKTNRHQNFLSTSFEIVATVFYIGKFFKKAPGTWGTLAALPIWYLMTGLSILPYMTITFLLLLVGVLIVQGYENQRQTHDSKEVVIDEVVGFLITMTWLPLTWQAAFFGFILFRILDIFKPFPISYIDKNVEGGVGVMADDVVAGILANLILQVLYSKTNWLGQQLIQFSN